MGLLGLGERDRERIEQGNEAMRQAADVLRLASRMGVVALLEGSRNSLLFECPVFKRLQALDCHSSMNVDLCVFLERR